MVSEVEGELREGVGDARPAARDVPARLGHRRAEARRARRDRRAGVDRPRGLHRRDRLREPARGPRAQRRDPHVRGPRRADLARRRRRHRRRLGGGGRGARGGREGRAAARRDRRRRRRRRRTGRTGAGPALRFVRRGPRPVPRPDPAAGLYETIRVVHGEAAGARRRTSRGSPRALRSLYGLPLPDALAERAARRRARARSARGCGSTSSPGEDAELAVTPLGEIPPAVLRPVVVARRPRPAQVARPHAARVPRGRRPGDAPAAARRRRPRARDEPHERSSSAAATATLYTPPADGRILPGVTAAHAGARPRALTLADLDAAAEVYVASALRGLSRAARTRAA